MGILMFLAPTSILLGLMGPAAFWWTVKNDQYDYPDGDAARFLNGHEDDGPL